MGGPAPHKLSAAAAARRGHRRGAAAALPNGVRRRAACAATRSPARRPALAHPRGRDHGSLTLRARPLSSRRFRSGAVRPHPSAAGAAFRAGETARGAGARPSRTRRTARLRRGTLPHPASAGVSSSPSYCDPRARRARRTREGAPATSGQGETFRPRRQALVCPPRHARRRDARLAGTWISICVLVRGGSGPFVTPAGRPGQGGRVHGI